MKYETKIGKPGDFPQSSKAAFDALVRTEGEVADGVLERLEHAETLVVLMEGETMIGVGAIKNPAAGYRAGVFRKAHAPQRPEDFPHEFGWVVVSKTHRGNRLSVAITDAALGAIEGRAVYATSRADNAPMHASLLGRGFHRTGKSYASVEHPGKEIALFVRP